MKSCRLLIHGFVYTLLPLVLWSCLEYSITTQVMPDGRITRTVMVKGDSADIFTGSFRVPSDSSWTITTRYEPRNQKDTTDSKIFVYEAKKEFKNFSDLNGEFFNDSALSDYTNIIVEFKKTWFGFINRYRYTETYSMLFPFRSVPVEAYLNDTELKIHLADDKDIYYSPEKDDILFVADSASLPVLSNSDSLRYRELRDTIEHKFEAWQKENIYNDFYQIVMKALDRLGKSLNTVTTKASFYAWLDSTKALETGLENDRAFVNAAAVYFHVNPVTLNNADREGFATFNKKFRLAAFTLESYTSIVIMPGKITRSNAKATGRHSASWTYRIDHFYASDYTMMVESRLFNKWFTLGTVAGLMLLTSLLLILRYRKLHNTGK